LKKSKSTLNDITNTNIKIKRTKILKDKINAKLYPSTPFPVKIDSSLEDNFIIPDSQQELINSSNTPPAIDATGMLNDNI